MGLLDSKVWRGERLIANSIKLSKITDVREVAFEAKDGRPAASTVYFTLALQEAALDTDGKTLEPGFFKEVGLNTYPDGAGGDDQLARMGQDNEKLFWRVVAAALAEANNDELPAKFQAKGGADALKGKVLKVQYKAKGTFQNIVDAQPA